MDAIVTKLMSIQRHEFEASLNGLDSTAQLDARGVAEVQAESGGAVRIGFEVLPPRRLGGLIVMPQARVTIDVTGLAEAHRPAFLRRFEIAFQRGGG